MVWTLQVEEFCDALTQVSQPHPLSGATIAPYVVVKFLPTGLEFVSIAHGCAHDRAYPLWPAWRIIQTRVIESELRSGYGQLGSAAYLGGGWEKQARSEEHTSELQSPM